MEFKEFVYKFLETLGETAGENIDVNTEISTLIDWNSMAVVNTIVFFDDEFNIDLSAEEVRECKTFGNLYKLYKNDTI